MSVEEAQPIVEVRNIRVKQMVWMEDLLQVAKAFVFTLKLCGWGLFLAIVTLLPYFWPLYSPYHYDHIDYKNNATIYLTTDIIRHSGKDVFSKFWALEVAAGYGVYATPASLILNCIMWTMYLRMTKLQVFIFVGVQVLLHVLQAGFLHLNEDESIARLNIYLGTMIPYTAPIALLKLILPSDCTAWKHAITITLLCCWSVVILTTFGIVRDMYGDFVLLLVYVPIYKLLCMLWTRNMVKKLLTESDAVGESVSVRREYAWGFLLCLQVFHAIWTRMLVTKLKDWEDYMLFLSANMAQEIILRLTIVHQDRIFDKLRCCLGNRNKNSKTNKQKKKSIKLSPMSSVHRKESRIVPSDGERSERTRSIQSDGPNTDKEEEMASNVANEWNALVIGGEMVAEYIGLFVNFGWMLMYADAIFVLPLPVFGIEERPFQDPMPIGNWIGYSAIQVLAELVVDVACLRIEESHGKLPVKKFWDLTPFRVTFLNFVVASCFGAGLSVTFLYLGTGAQTSTRWCTSYNLCSCLPPKESLYGRYCLHLYPETNGLPPLEDINFPTI